MQRTDIGRRLKEEREKIGLSQAELSKVTGASTRTHIAWEKGEQTPNAVYLAAMNTQSINVNYVVTGQKSLSNQDLENELEQLSLAWEALVQALQQAEKTLTPSQMRQAAEALYKAVKAGDGEAKSLSKLVAEAA